MDRLLGQIAEITGEARNLKGRRIQQAQRIRLVELSKELGDALTESIYPHPLPTSIFDPSDSRLFGLFAALALLAQDLIPLADVSHIYGSGIYAIYYTGDFDDYLPIAHTETPIYVGKSQPDEEATRIQEQGTPLTSRLLEHRKSIGLAETLDLEDFSCRYLVVRAGWEKTAELELMRYFRPLWNEGTGPVHGLGKHGDAAETRQNRRSPWDTLHPGRKWATNILEDQVPLTDIKKSIAAHFQECKPVPDRESVIDHYFSTIGKPNL